MAKLDIQPYTDPHGSHGSVRRFPMNASETFDAGEPVAVNADGELTESADDPVDADLMGIALGGPGASNNYPGLARVYATGDLIPVVIPNSDTLFVTRNYSEAGSAFNDTAPVVARIGDECGLSLISDEWGVDITATNNTCRIIDILDENKRSLLETGGTVSTADGNRISAPAYYVVFQIVAHQSITVGSADAPAA